MIATGAIALMGIKKSFRAYHARSTKETLVRLASGRSLTDRRVVIDGLDLHVAPGEIVGIVGRNGAGKSTLFRIISGILEVEAGTVEVGGRVSPLIEITAGLVMDMTGRENIFLNAGLLGLPRGEIKRRFDKIVEFAGLKDFLDTPARYYSSGMQARLGFSVGTHVDADIMLVDEALSVGDVDFQKQCIERMRSLATNGVTILLVSHDEGLVHAFAQRVVRLEGGQIQDAG